MIAEISADVPRHTLPSFISPRARTKSHGARHARDANKPSRRSVGRCEVRPDWATSLCASPSIWQCQELVSNGKSNLRIQFFNGTTAEGDFQCWHLGLDRNDGKFRAQIVIWDKAKNYEYVTYCDALQIANVTAA